MTTTTQFDQTDVVLIGAGIMSATLGVLLKELQPELKITIYERLDIAAAESSDAWNNAGTGHAAYCELNYTPQLPDGTVDVSKAIKISESFEVSRQLWAYMVAKGMLNNPDEFIKSVPHLSLVWGQENVDYLEKRYQELQKYELFKDMEFTKNPETIKQWAPLIMEDRKDTTAIACTAMKYGTDVNFGALTRNLLTYLEKQEGVRLHFNHEVTNLHKTKDNQWKLKVKNLASNKTTNISTPFVFIGAGGGSLLLLEKANIPEGHGYGGFPVSGQWLKCVNEEIIKKHHVKVYGKASVGAPPMSVPHIDTRVINGKKELLFGPYAGFSTKFLKNGSYLDLIASIELSNVVPMLQAGIKNIPLTKYLIEQVFQSSNDRLTALKEYVPSAKKEDWVLETAGQRVQVIKKDKKGQGVLEFGTEVVAANDGSLAVLLGASPGASTATSIMIELIEKCFPEQMQSKEWQEKFKEMIPSFGLKLNEHPALVKEIREKTNEVLRLKV